MKSSLSSSDPIHILRQEFRNHLEEFYAFLKLAPPYHSIEKAVQYLSNTLRTKTEEFRHGLLNDPNQKWSLFQEVFSASGLQNKHRGIIQQLSLSSAYSPTSPEALCFLSNFSDTLPQQSLPVQAGNSLHTTGRKPT
jgi:hypothetical protein